MNQGARRFLGIVLLTLATVPYMAEGASEQAKGEAGAPYATQTSLKEPLIFAPGVISTGDYESHAAFAPDGKTLYFLKDAPDFSFWTVLHSPLDAGES